MTDILKARIEKALSTDCEVNFSNQPHFIITEVLNDYIYKRYEEEDDASIRVIYLNGGEAERFPLRCLPKAQVFDDVDSLYSPLRAALVSMRHLEMDEHVDFAWFRNRKVSASLSCADTDKYLYGRDICCFEKTCRSS